MSVNLQRKHLPVHGLLDVVPALPGAKQNENSKMLVHDFMFRLFLQLRIYLQVINHASHEKVS